jgi:hypothetical protein
MVTQAYIMLMIGAKLTKLIPYQIHHLLFRTVSALSHQQLSSEYFMKRSAILMLLKK